MKLCSQEISRLTEEVKEISDTLGLRFQGVKTDITEVHISSGGRMASFFVGYDSEVLKVPGKIKIEVNLVDSVLRAPRPRRLRSYAEGIDSAELKFLYDKEWKEYTSNVRMRCYDARDIFAEKCRAALTRKAYKLRDLLDIYFMEKDLGYTVQGLKRDIIRKTTFMVDLYKRYHENFMFTRFPRKDLLLNGEMNLLLVDVPSDLGDNIARIQGQLHELKDELVAHLKSSK